MWRVCTESDVGFWGFREGLIGFTGARAYEVYRIFKQSLLINGAYGVYKAYGVSRYRDQVETSTIVTSFIAPVRGARSK